MDQDNSTRFAALKHGIVTKIDPKTSAVKVKWLDQDIESYWLPVTRMGAQNNKHYAMPDIGEQVVCLMDHLQEDGVILGSIYSKEDIPPIDNPEKTHTTFKDGAVMEYDRENHHALMDLPGTARFKAGGSTIDLDGDKVLCSSDVIAAMISLVNHTHDGVQSGSGTSGPPTGGGGGGGGEGGGGSNPSAVANELVGVYDNA